MKRSGQSSGFDCPQLAQTVADIERQRPEAEHPIRCRDDHRFGIVSDRFDEPRPGHRSDKARRGRIMVGSAAGPLRQFAVKRVQREFQRIAAGILPQRDTLPINYIQNYFQNYFSTNPRLFVLYSGYRNARRARQLAHVRPGTATARRLHEPMRIEQRLRHLMRTDGTAPRGGGAWQCQLRVCFSDLDGGSALQAGCWSGSAISESRIMSSLCGRSGRPGPVSARHMSGEMTSAGEDLVARQFFTMTKPHSSIRIS